MDLQNKLINFLGWSPNQWLYVMATVDLYKPELILKNLEVDFLIELQRSWRWDSPSDPPDLDVEAALTKLVKGMEMPGDPK